jgi:hypothetical protein
MVREVAEVTTRLVPAVDPNFTAVAPVNPVPVTVTVVPPAAGPKAGEMPVMVGTGAYVNWSAAEVRLVPDGVVTVISTIPVPAGEVAVILVAEVTVKPDAGFVPNITAVAPVNPVPVTVTLVPPPKGPRTGAMLVTVGAYVNLSAAEVTLVPDGVVTVISTIPVPAGEAAVIWVAEFTVKPDAKTAPNFTAVAPVNPVPVTVTEVPPAAGPKAGEIPVIVGA